MTDNSGSASGAVFDIRRFSVHDGEGIRTTVFLKGCPLRCRWCQNPEGLESRFKPVWLSGACIHCGVCTKIEAAVRPGSALPELTPRAWDAVMDACPAKALVWDGRIMTVDEVITEVAKDAAFFAYGGGLTLSGGEPLAQPGFALALLEKARGAGFHTAIETSLFAPAEVVESAVALCDTIIADCKIFDEARHIEATGQSNGIILQNLRLLLTERYARKVLIRTPLIPAFTADEENIAAISAFVSGLYKDVDYELLNYNPLGAGKYPLTGREYYFTENPKPFTAEETRRFKDVARKNGITKEVLYDRVYA
ncbi:MAG: glycyl-radical enzyme activating protein [Treponema sp.]|jgi:pyruvate formate lyase activating enzyme|nr:glycyl-radical enzyme activating protein [Treponema sp.]